MRKLLVTGGAGFIGANFVTYWTSKYPNDHVVVIDALTYAGNKANLVQVEDHPHFQFVHGDIGDKSLVQSLLVDGKLDTIVHFAAESHVDRSIHEPDAFIQTNVNGTHNLLKVAREVWLDSDDAPATHRFHHVSTDEVYGTLGPDDPAFTEETPYAPNSPYAASKAASDHLVRAYHHTFGLQVSTSNCSNNYGPYQFPEKLIPLMILNALDGKPLPIYGDGGNIRDWIYVEDHCAGIVRALEAGRPGEQYVFGGNSELSNLQVVDAICDELDSLRPVAENQALKNQGIDRYSELKSFVEDRPGHDRRYAIDASKAKRELDWTPEVDFQAALNRTIVWYLEHDDWQRAIRAEGDARSRQGLSAGTPNTTTQGEGKDDPK